MTDPLDRIRRPEYTGENRCWPCTITNSIALAVLVGGLAILGRRLTAGVVALAGTVAIALRGYVVPYTPRFAPTLVGTLPIDPFDHGRPDAGTGSLSNVGSTADGADPAVPTGETVLSELLEAGAIAVDGDEIVLERDFREEWHREMRTLREADLATLERIADRRTDSSVDARTRRNWGRSVLVLDGGDALVTLPRGVAVAELAATRALEGRVDSPAIRRAAGRPLRSLLERCPLCDGPVTVSRSSCCGEVTPIGRTPPKKLVCSACNERFFTFDADESER
ncbi:hypothetical protein [Natronorubrum halophilum]|uniref:hypothetical protein n=1 Tax=Natronorubrum halophilum TaxID=1702106 RepID=UPI000EF70856|nr:hypothetical protein [Natronorubrum halophilum]